MKFTWTSLLYWFRLYRLCQMYRHILEHFILFGVSGTAKAPSGFNATAAGGVYKAYLTSYIKWFVYTIWPDVHLPKYIHSHSDVRLDFTFCSFELNRLDLGFSSYCLFGSLREHVWIYQIIFILILNWIINCTHIRTKA